MIPDTKHAMNCKVIVQGRIGERYAHWFDDMTITPLPDGTTQFAGTIADDAALYGILGRFRDLGMSIVSVSRELRPPGADTAGASEPST